MLIIIVCSISAHAEDDGEFQSLSRGSKGEAVIKLQEPKLSKYPLLKKDFKLMFRNTSGSVSFIVLAFISLADVIFLKT